MHVGTHHNAFDYYGGRSPHAALAQIRRAFAAHNWTETHHFAGGPYPGRLRETSHGPVLFGDGVLSLRNTRALACEV